MAGEGITSDNLPNFGSRRVWRQRRQGPKETHAYALIKRSHPFPVLSQPWFSELGKLSQTIANLPSNHSQTIRCGTYYPSGSSLRFVPFSPLLPFLCPIFGHNLSPPAQPSPRSTPRNPPSFPLRGSEKAPSFWFGAGPRAPIVSTQNRNGWWHGQGIAWQVAKEHWG